MFSVCFLEKSGHFLSLWYPLTPLHTITICLDFGQLQRSVCTMVCNLKVLYDKFLVLILEAKRCGNPK